MLACRWPTSGMSPSTHSTCGKSIGIIEAAFDGILRTKCVPLTIGGDHTIVLPILRAMQRKHGPVGLVHVDAHSDTNDTMFGEAIAHGAVVFAH